MKKPARIALGVAGILVVLAAVGAGVWLAMIVNRADEVAAEVERPLEDERWRQIMRWWSGCMGSLRFRRCRGFMLIFCWMGG